MQILEQYCAEIYDAKNYTTATIYPIWVLIGLMYLAIPVFIILPCKKLIIIRYLQNGVMQLLKMLDFNVTNVPFALTKTEFGDVKVHFPEKQLIRKIALNQQQNQQTYQQPQSEEDALDDPGTPTTPQGFFGQTGGEHEKTIYLKKVNRIIGGYVTMGLLIVQWAVFLFIYYTWNSAVSEHVTTYSTELTHQPKPQIIKFQIQMPCSKTDDIKGHFQSTNNIVQDFQWKILDGREGRCDVEATVSLFKTSVFNDESNGTYRGVQFQLGFDGMQVTKKNDEIQYKTHTIFAPASKDVEDEYPRGNHALYFIDSCRQSYVPVNENEGVSMFMSGQVRVKCFKYFGTAAYCSYTDEMISLNPTRYVKAAEGQFLLHFEIPNLLLNTYIAHKNDTVMYMVLVLCLISVFVFQPVLKRHLVYITAITLQRKEFGKGIGYAKGFLMGVVTCLYMYTLCFISFIFLSDVVIDFERLTPSFSFNDTLFIFGRDSEFMLINLVLVAFIILANIALSVLIIFLTMMYLGSDAEDKIFNQLTVCMPLYNWVTGRQQRQEETVYDTVDNSDL